MEYGLWQNVRINNKRFLNEVLILVLMEYGLWLGGMLINLSIN